MFAACLSLSPCARIGVVSPTWRANSSGREVVGLTLPRLPPQTRGVSQPARLSRPPTRRHQASPTTGALFYELIFSRFSAENHPTHPKLTNIIRSPPRSPMLSMSPQYGSRGVHARQQAFLHAGNGGTEHDGRHGLFILASCPPPGVPAPQGRRGLRRREGEPPAGGAGGRGKPAAVP